MRHGIAVIVFLAGIAVNVSAQTALTPSEIEHLDSLMFNLEFSEIERVIAERDQSAIQNSLDLSAEYQEQQSRYRRVIRTVERVVAQEDEFIKEYVVSRLPENYDIVSAGFRATEKFEDFRSDVMDFRYREAVPKYEAAKYFKTLHVGYVQEMLEDHYARAKLALQDQDYSSAQATIDSVDVYSDSRNSFHREYLDSLAILKGDLDDATKFARQQNELWGRNQPVRMRAGIMMTADIVSTGSLDKVVVPGYDSILDQTVTLEAEELSNSRLFTFGAEAMAFFSPRLAAGFKIQTGSYSFSNASDETLVFMDFDTSVASGAGFMVLVLRPFVGLRPYVKVGAGLSRFTRDAANVVILRINPDGTGNREDYFVDDESISETFALTSIGFDYIHCPTCKLVVGAEFQTTLSETENQYLPRTRPSIGLRLGYFLTR